MTMKLYNTVISGNCYKIRLLLSFLNLDYEKVSINLGDQEQKTEHFLKLNPLGQIPVLEDQGRHIHDSQAILCYLARTYDAHQLWFPQETITMTRILEWLFFANQRIASSLSAARAFHLIKKPNIDIEHATVMSHASLAVVNQHLKTRHWLVGESATIADIACYPYIALAHQGKIELDLYPDVQAWLTRFQQLPRFIELDE